MCSEFEIDFDDFGRSESVAEKLCKLVKWMLSTSLWGMLMVFLLCSFYICAWAKICTRTDSWNYSCRFVGHLAMRYRMSGVVCECDRIFWDGN